MMEDTVCWYTAERGYGGDEDCEDVVDVELRMGVIDPVDVAPTDYLAIGKQGKKERKEKAMVRERDTKVDSDQGEE